MRNIILIALCLFGLIPSIRAETDSPLRNQKEALNKTQEELDQELQQKEKLAEKIESIHAELTQTKETLISTAALIRENETNLRDLESRIDKLEESKKVMEEKLYHDRSSIARLILALERIRRSPPEAMLARPESPYKTAQSALLMGQLIPALERHTQALKKNLETLDNVSEDLKKEQENHLILSDSLNAQHQTLSSLLEARENIYIQTNQDIQTKESNIQKISLKAQNLEDLVRKLKDEEIRERNRMEAEKENNTLDEEGQIAALSESLRIKQALSKPAGQPQLPISGTIKVQFKQKDDLGAPSNGLTIEGRSAALVVAPLAGKVQFAGEFKKYGNIVIIEHENGFHSLVAGLEKIDTLVGEYVESGEPIGALPAQSSSGPPPKLYYELRQNGKPVNPSVKFAELG